MSVSEKDSGIVDKHTLALEATARQENTFIFVRPTEFDTTVLIRAGYATKSMDVHHKSSNWGPMAGFVPCDPAFSKKCEGKPNPKEHEHKHGAAHPSQLTLTDALLQVHEKIKLQPDFELVAAPPSTDKAAFKFVAKRRSGSAPKQNETPEQRRFREAQSRFNALDKSGELPEYKFCTAEPSDFGNKATLFCLVRKGAEWAVYWVEWKGENGILHQLRVFAYPQSGKLVPVTGDYDLWMVAPHFKHFDTHVITRIQKDKHGSSAASGYTLGLIPRMNAACARTSNPVFNHGAEAQNYGFTQALDWNLAMFTPAGTSRMVRMNQMAGILADLERMGYLIVWNKRYGETDPRLMNKADEKTNLSELRSEMDRLFNDLDEIRRNANSKLVAQQTVETRQMPQSMKDELAKMAQRFKASRDLGLEQSRIYRFNRQLLAFLNSYAAPLRVLKSHDFPGALGTQDLEVRMLQSDLHRVLVEATTGSGESNEKLLRSWLESHRMQIDKLKSYWS